MMDSSVSISKCTRYGSDVPVAVVYVKNDKTVQKEFGADYYAARRFYAKLVRKGFEPHVIKSVKNL
jgi:hypothetical protein